MCQRSAAHQVMGAENEHREKILKSAFDAFLVGKSLNTNQLQFINLIVDELTRTGVMEQSRLFESPYIDLAPTGIQGLFSGGLAKDLQTALTKLRESAEAV